MREWSADIVVDGALARRLVGQQFREIDVATLRPLADGFDNSVWLAEERWFFRFPRRAAAVAGVERELALLPVLAPLLPLRIPTPSFVGAPVEDYPWPFFGGRLIPGREIAEAAVSDAGRTGLAGPLAGFLRKLHGREVAAAVDVDRLPYDPAGRADMGRRIPATRRCLDELERVGRWQRSRAVDDILAAAAGLGPSEAATVTHGDLHLRHLLVDGGGAATGVIDWGDLCRADPTIDLALYWSLLTPAGRADFLAEYGRLADDQLLRARVVALFLCAVLAVYAHREGIDALEREALRELARTTT